MNQHHTENLNIVGNPDASIVVVTDAPYKNDYQAGRVMSNTAMRLFLSHAQTCGFEVDDFIFITPCPPIPGEAEGSAKREKLFITTYTQEFEEAINEFGEAKLIMYLGPKAALQLHGSPVKITKARGKVSMVRDYTVPVLAMLSPTNVLKRPDVLDIFATDFQMAQLLAQSNWEMTALEQSNKEGDYQYCLDLTGWLLNPPRAMSVDTESKGGEWFRPTCKVLTVQLCREEGKSVIVPLDVDWYNRDDPDVPLTYRNRAMLKDQLIELLGNPNVAVTGSNLSSDIHKLRKEGIEIANWRHETQQLAFVVDDNMLEKGLSECTRRWVQPMSGYSDAFDRKIDKSHMELVSIDEMRPYSGADPDASMRLTKTLVKLGKVDSRNWNCYQRIQMPALRMFNGIEEVGIRVDRQALRELGVAIEEEVNRLYDELIVQVPASIKRLHEKAGLSFTRAEFLIDILFRHPDGFKLTPVVWTDGTKKMPNIKDRKPSTSKKDHLPYFKHIPFVAQLIEWKTLEKMQSTYVGEEGGKLIEQRRKNAPPRYTEPSGFWQYLDDEGRIHPSYFLHRTVTGRVASAYPNGQNFPKRGKLAKAFRKIFIPDPGYVFIEADLSQAELRIAAWMANETTMLNIYRRGGDIHEYTAAAIMGVPLAEFKTWKGSDELLPDELLAEQTVQVETYGDLYELKRYQAKSVAFGFLYGMGWKKFKTYAKTDYGLDFTDEEAQEFRRIFFALYPKLEAWHRSMRTFVKKNGYVRALHGALRRLPSIYSSDEIVRGECERQAINSPVQRFGSCDLTLIGMIRFVRDADLSVMRPVGMIHDSGIFRVKREYAEEAMSAIKAYFETPPLQEWFGLTPPIPIISDVKISDKNLSEMEERPDVVAQFPSWYNEELDLAA